MPVEVISYMLSNKDKRKRLQFQIILQCAPFLKGLKVASIMNIEKQYCQELKTVFEGTDIEYKILSVNQERCLVFFFRRDKLAAYLEKDEVRRFLEHYGYACRDIEKVLSRLSRRVCQYSWHDSGFPHEIGAFLDYPIEDVRCFIEKEGKEELMTGYWKVYHDLGKAQMTFLTYDKARTSAVNEFLTGKTIRDIQKGTMKDECSDHRWK